MNHVRLTIALGLLFLPVLARADGGVVRAREVNGPFTVTIFTPQDTSTTVPADVTVMVQRSDNSEVVTNAKVGLGFAPPPGANLAALSALCCAMNNAVVPGVADDTGHSPDIPATRAHVANRLLYGATIILPVPGDWRVRATVRRGNEESVIAFTLPVAISPRRLAGLWPYLALPPVAIALFALNQWLRRRPTRPFLAKPSQSELRNLRIPA